MTDVGMVHTQRVEDTVLPDSNGLYVRDETADDDAAADADEAASVKVSARVRDIVTRNLAPPNGDSSTSPAVVPTRGVEELAEENRILQVCLKSFLQYLTSGGDLNESNVNNEMLSQPHLNIVLILIH